MVADSMILVENRLSVLETAVSSVQSDLQLIIGTLNSMVLQRHEAQQQQHTLQPQCSSQQQLPIEQQHSLQQQHTLQHQVAFRQQSLPAYQQQPALQQQQLPYLPPPVAPMVQHYAANGGSPSYPLQHPEHCGNFVQPSVPVLMQSVSAGASPPSPSVVGGGPIYPSQHPEHCGNFVQPSMLVSLQSVSAGASLPAALQSESSGSTPSSPKGFAFRCPVCTKPQYTPKSHCGHIRNVVDGTGYCSFRPDVPFHVQILTCFGSSQRFAGWYVQRLRSSVGASFTDADVQSYIRLQAELQHVVSTGVKITQ